MLEGVQFPFGVVTFAWSGEYSATKGSGKLTTSVANLNTSLTDVNGDDFPHGFVRIRVVIERVGVGEDGGNA